MLADLEAVLFDPDEFDTAATLTTTGPVVSTVNVKFQEKVTAVAPFSGDVDVETGHPHCLGIATEFSVAKQDDELIVDSVTYKINRVVDDGTGLALIWLYT